MDSNKRTLNLAILSDYLISKIPFKVKGRDSIVSWLNYSPYSPYVTLYGGERSNTYNEDKSFVSNLDNKKRYMLEDNISFNFEKFERFGNEIFSANNRLDDLIDADTLFRAYPEFRDIELNINISNSYNDNYSGSTYYDTDGNKPYKIDVYADCNENGMRVLLHELQHCIQLKEGFEHGASYYGDDGVVDKVVYHGSKYDFDEFSPEFIGEGIGLQAYGWGLYFAEDKDIASHYKDKLGSVILINGESFDANNPTHYARRVLKRNSNMLNLALTELNRELKYSTPENINFQKEALKILKKEKYNLTCDIVGIKYEDSINKSDDLFNLTKSNNFVVFNKKNINILTKILPDGTIKKNTHAMKKEEREKNFKEWFGDSKVVDKNGEPLAVYHSSKVKFDIFDENKSKTGWLGKGFYFTDNKTKSKEFGKKTHEVYLQMQNPYISQSVSPSELMSEVKDKFASDETFSEHDISIVLRKNGYDGVIYKHWDSDFGVFYSVFSSTQIKSIHNSGKFNPENPNILEKNDYGLKQIEKLISIIPDGMNRDNIFKYLEFNGVGEDDIKESGYGEAFNRYFFVNPIKSDIKNVDVNSSYFNNKGEIECRGIEERYVDISYSDFMIKRAEEEMREIDDLKRVFGGASLR